MATRRVKKKRPMGLALAATPDPTLRSLSPEPHMLTIRAPHPAMDLGIAADDTDIRFQAPTELMLAHAEQVLAKSPGMTAQDLLRRFAKDIRELNGDPCKEEFNPDTEIMKIEAQYQLVQKLTALAKQAGGRRRRRTRRKNKKSKRGGGWCCGHP